jgi:hypothetical protein
MAAIVLAQLAVTGLAVYGAAHLFDRLVAAHQRGRARLTRAAGTR